VSFNLEALLGDKVEFTLKYGQGGFNESRSEIGKLGGGQIALEIQYLPYPVAISLTGEYYTNSANPTHWYEVSDLTAINILYIVRPLFPERIKLFAGGGFGVLEVPKEGLANMYNKNWLGNIEAGVSYRIFWKLGAYGAYKYLYSRKKENNEYVIDFHEHVLILGIQLSFKI
jgi:hypothetical protein